MKKYEHVNNLVIKYQDNEGREQSIQELVNAFKPFLGKYYNIIRKGVLNLEDYDSRRFVSLFVSDKDMRYRLKMSRLGYKTKVTAYKVAEFIRYCFETTSCEDIDHQIKLALLELADRYLKNKKNISFAGYVYSSYRYELFRSIKSHMQDPLTNRKNIMTNFNDGEYIYSCEDLSSDPSILEDKEHLSIVDEDLDSNWIRGITCSDIFKEISIIDRSILIMKYIDGITDTEISKRTGYHRNTIANKRNAAKKVLEKQYGKDN